MKLSKILVCTLASLLISVSALAQKVAISGTVVDSDNYPLPGASVIIDAQKTGAITDVNGNFTLDVKKGDVLSVSFLGFLTKTVKVTDAVKYFIVLEEDSNLLEETVVVGYETQKKVNLTGAVSSVSADALKNRPIVQASTALQGAMAGVTVTTQSGAPGADGGTIRIRGIGTFGGSSAAPLVLIDGIEGTLDAVDASQIDQISVLKDAASSAIYGSRAANGVILVTTKRGVKGHTGITYRGYVGWQTPTDLPETVNAEEYMTLYREADMNDGKESFYTPEYISNYRANNAIDPDTYPITNWKQKLLTGSGFTHNHNISMTAATDKVKVNTSFGYLDQEGIIKRTDFQRYNMRNNMNVDLSNNFKLKFDFSLVFTERNRLPNQNTIFNYMNTRDPLILTQYSSGLYAGLSGSSVNVIPILEQGEGGNIKNQYLRLNSAVALTWSPADWVTFEGTAAPRFVMSNSHTFKNKIPLYADAFGAPSAAANVAYNSLEESNSQAYYGNYLFTAAFKKTIAKNHNFRALLGTSYETYGNKSLMAYRQEFAYPDYEVISAGKDDETKDNSGKRNQWALQSFFGRVNYNYKERYLFEANIRYDGSSRFSKENRWGVFPSFSGAWRVTEEPWLKGIKNTLTELKVRGSWGELGNQNIGSYYPTIQDLAVSSISVNNTVTPIVTLTTLANPDITWETTRMTDIGIDASLWNKLSLTADWYYKRTYGILMTLDIPTSIGLSAPYQNAGVVDNIGWEVALNYGDRIGDFKFNVGANLSDVRNTIVDMKGTNGGSGVIRNQEGSEINSIYALKCIGIARTQEEADWVNENCPQYKVNIKPGDLVYEDYNEDGKIDDLDAQIIGGTIPRYTYGFNFDVEYKGFAVSAMFQGVGKADALLSSYYIQPCVQGGTFRKEHLDRWTPETAQTAAFPRLSWTDKNNKYNSSFWMKSTAYCRLKNLQVSYTVPKKFANKLHLKNLMFFANGQNVFTFTNFFQGYDPEIAYSSSGTDGVELGAIAYNYPQVKTYTFGVEVKF